MASPEAIRAWGESRRVGGRNQRPGVVAAAPSLIRLAWVGRTSTYDQQDPTLSLPRQLRTSMQALPDNAVIVVHFYDVESGRKDLADRGRGRAHEMFQIPIPRDGGMSDLLEEAARSDRRFDAVICESIDRIARRAYIATEIEHLLEQAGVPLLAADEPIQLGERTVKPKTATQVLTRRLKQGVAEWYVVEMLEKSWAGFEVHTEHGYNVGKACYGYQANRVPHPVPAKRAKGVKKTLLVVHPLEGPVVRKMFAWRVGERLGYGEIAKRLNRDLAMNPPPVPVEADRARGQWTWSNVRDVLTNPKHTGHMVWNRRARKGKGKNRANPVEEWVWSPEPVHEALVDLETFVLAQQVAPERERSRASAGVNSHPRATRVYPLRSYLFCELCGRRMCGRAPRGTSYYVCAPKSGYTAEGHPGNASIWVREEALVRGVNAFLADRVFGQYRADLLAANLTMLDQANRGERDRQIAALRRSIIDTETRSRRLIRNLELADEPDQDMIRDINERRAELRAERDDLRRQLTEIEEHVSQETNPALLQALPVGSVDLEALPDGLSRRLFEAVRLEIYYNRETNIARCKITLTAETIPAVCASANAAVIQLTEHAKINKGEVALVAHQDQRIMHHSVLCPQRDSNPCCRLERAVS